MSIGLITNNVASFCRKKESKSWEPKLSFQEINLQASYRWTTKMKSYFPKKLLQHNTFEDIYYFKWNLNFEEL